MKVTCDFRGIPLLFKALKKKKMVQLDFAGKTLRELIQNLVRKYGGDIKKAILDGNNDVDMEIRVVLNEKTYLSGNRMETVLNEGDIVSFRGAS